MGRKDKGGERGRNSRRRERREGGERRIGGGEEIERGGGGLRHGSWGDGRPCILLSIYCIGGNK